MAKIISKNWALFFGLALIMLGNGLQGTLLGVRATMEAFSITAIGMMMSGYYIGVLAGSSLVPKMVGNVGHVRSFGVLASLASSSILVHAVFVDPIVWWLMRFVTGFAYAGLYIVAESWINDASENNNRGQLMSVYMLVSLGGLAGGQLMLNIADPASFKLFMLISVLVSLSLVPILASTGKAPAFETAESVSILRLFRISPLGIGGLLIGGIAAGAMYSMAAVYATGIGLSVRDISFALVAMVMGGITLQYPLGRLSDIFGRRRVIVATSLTGFIITYFIAFAGAQSGWLVYVQISLAGGLAMPLYSLCVAHINDYLNPRQMVAASSAMVLTNGFGAAVGAPMTAFAMSAFGPSGFFITIGTSLMLVALIAIWRISQRPEISAEDRSDFVVIPPTPVGVAMNPDVELASIEAAANKSAAAVDASFDKLESELSELDQESG